MHCLNVDKKNWRELYQCPSCNQTWVVEHNEIMNKSPRLAFKLLNRSNWLRFDYRKAIETFKIQKHGGLSDKACLIKDCTNKRLLNTYLCATHFIPT